MATRGRPLDLTGLRFGRLMALFRTTKQAANRCYLWVVKCDCGQEIEVASGKLVAGESKSCGCLRRETSAANGKKRRPGTGSSSLPQNKPTWRSWNAMRARCCATASDDYANYGGRGISVCERWNSFENFLADMGRRPTGTSIDRIDNDGNYEPGNCRWATHKEQARNRRSNRLLTCYGETKSMAQWAEETGMHPACLLSRLSAGWSVERALSK